MDACVVDRHAVAVRTALHAIHCYTPPYLDALSGAAGCNTPTRTECDEIQG